MARKTVVGAVCGLAVTFGAAGVLASDNRLCAGYFDKQVVRDAYFGYGGNPTAPMAIPSHTLRIVESKVTSSFNAKQAVGTPSTPERFKKVWQSVDTWGENHQLNVVVTVDGWHAFSFPVKVPVTRKGDHATGFYDVFGENGEGVRGHINPDLVSLIYAVRLPQGDGTYQRSVSFYDNDGDLILGLYATEGKKPQNEDLIAGFDRTWDLIASMPRACKD